MLRPARMAAQRGAFILFEGVDRCGKTTQATKLVESLNSTGQKAVLMRFPDRTTAMGSLINKYLTKEIELDDRAVHLLFSANRWERCPTILSHLRSGTHVVVDRYAHSGVCFSSAKTTAEASGMTLDWCKAPDAGLPMPDRILFMELAPEAAALRGGFGGERYELPEFQRVVKSRFDSLKKETDAADPSLWINVDAAGTIDAIHDNIRGLAATTIAGAATAPIRKLWTGEVLPTHQ